MGSDIATATAEPRPQPPAAAPPAAAAPAPVSGRRRPRLSPLTRQILTVNVLALGLVVFGLLYLGEYQRSLIAAELDDLRTQGQIFAAALGEGAVIDSLGEGETLIPELGRQMMRRLVEPTHIRARLFDAQGKLIADSRVLRGPGGMVQINELPPPGERGPLDRLSEWLYDAVLGLVPGQRHYPPYEEAAAQNAGDYREVQQALLGEVENAVRRDRDSGGLVLSVAVPVQRYKQVLGAVMLSRDSSEIDQALRSARFEILKWFAIALSVTVLLSIYLAVTIARPIRRRACAPRPWAASADPRFHAAP